MLAETYIPVDRMSWWGGPDERVRCSVDDKVVFYTEQAAQQSVDRATHLMKCYKGKCGHWHLARV